MNNFAMMASRGGGQGSTKIDKKTGNYCFDNFDVLLPIISVTVIRVEYYGEKKSSCCKRP